MKRYALKTKTGEVINTINAVDKDHAVELFAEIKKIPREEILNIYHKISSKKLWNSEILSYSEGNIFSIFK